MTKKTTLLNRYHLPNLPGFLGSAHCPLPPSTSPRPLPTVPPVLLSILQLNPLHCSRPPASTHPQPNPLHSPHRRNHSLWHSTPSTTMFARTLSCHRVSWNVYLLRYRHLFVNGSRICHSRGYVASPAAPLRLPGTIHLWIALLRTQRKTFRRLRHSPHRHRRLATLIRKRPLHCFRQMPPDRLRTSSKMEPKHSPCSSTASNLESSGGSWVFCNTIRVSLVAC